MATQPVLATIPAGYKPGTLYSQLPVDGVGDFTVARNSIATRVNQDGIIEEVSANTPRLDYLNGSCPDLLCEPDSVNEFVYSEDFSDASWVKANVDIISNSLISPDGTLSTNEINSNVTTSDEHRVRKTTSLSTSTTYTVSVFVQQKDSGVYFYFRDLTNGVVSIIDVENSTVILNGVNQIIDIDVYNNYLRLSITFTTPSSIVNNLLDIGITTSNTGITSIIPLNQGLYFWGAQLEENTYSTSYIKTEGAVVTRLADVINGAGDASLLNSSEYTFFLEAKSIDDATRSRRITVSDGTTANRINIEFDETNGVIRSQVNAVLLEATGLDFTQYNKIAVKVKVNDAALWINGVEESNNLSVIVPSNLSTVQFSGGGGLNNFYGKTKQLKVFNIALSDAELQDLTSI